MNYILFKNCNDTKNEIFELNNFIRVEVFELSLIKLFDRRYESIADVKNKLIFRIYISILTKGKVKIYNAINKKGKIVHSSYVIPKNIKYSFLKKNDVVIGPCFTNPEYRGKGIYPFVLNEIKKDMNDKNIYMFIKRENIASIHGVEKAGFKKCKNGIYNTKIFKIFKKTEIKI